MEVKAYLIQRRPPKSSIAATAEPTYAFGSDVENQIDKALQKCKDQPPTNLDTETDTQ